MKMDFNITFHPVGFGLFTSGQIGNFNFIYDCGSTSTSTVDKCIEDEFQDGENINLLVISHFHRDHINGLKKLLNKVGRIDTIILPYLTPRERLNYFFALDLDYPDDWINDFFVDPVDALLNLGFADKISNIVFISGGPKEYFNENKNDNIEGPDFNNEDIVFNLNNLETAEEAEAILTIEGITDPRVLIKKHGRVPLTLLKNRIVIWQFIFYYCTQSEKVEKYFKKIADCSNLTIDNISKNELQSIVNNTKFSKIAKEFKVSNSDINNTSLLMYHSPTLTSELNAVHLWSLSRLFYLFEYSDYLNNPFGYFYTGDVNLREKHKEISIYYGPLISQVALFQVPHHGSIDNWNNFLSYKNPGMLHVFSSRYSNPSGLHPNNEVLYQITKCQGITMWCHEDNKVKFTGLIHFR